jgi:DNA-binding NtrC family response regulator
MSEHVIVVEDDRELRSFLTEVLEEAGYHVAAFPTGEIALEHIARNGDGDVVITDLMMPGMRGQELLQEVRRRRPEINVITITAFGSIDSAIQLVKLGAYDYLTKPFGSDELLLTVDRALAESRLRREVASLSRAVTPFHGIIGASRIMQELTDLIRRAGSATRPILITGESGTGKELVARALHALSDRREFIPVNCAAIPDNLLESELFGHERGAFTGADRTRIGLIEAAHKGTLFLDEVGELPLPLQPKLLRAIETGEVRRVGATESRTVDIRVIAATNKDLEAEIEAGRFRDDLYWRLHVVPIHVPPLRARPADIPLLAERFADGRAITPEAVALLTAYPWPGNVRELRNAIERALTLSAGDSIRPEDLPPRIQKAGRAAVIVADASRRQVPLRDLERDYILEILRQVGGNKTRAADILGLDRKTLYRKLDEYRLEDPPVVPP